ncbi:low temperature requirement protein A [Kineococcus sp. TBRC 1896]|uniref:Low temperature requirement protein A n=1 Tax=Kineococcus mangrovi TaxID=1660183 RepID=A0ABV4HZX1_9ACTN
MTAPLRPGAHDGRASTPRRWPLPVASARDRREQHRTASPLELFFDLVFVVAISLASAELHHALSSGHVADGLVVYAAVFFAVWWAWVNFTWFASAFDTDDWLYRLLTFVQMAGVLLLAAGVPDAFADHDLTLITLGYVVMRLAVVVQWLRAAGGNEALRSAASRYAVGTTVVQVGWTVRLHLTDQGGWWTFLVLAAVELLVPAWAERAQRTPWHPHHIAERYGLFTLIVLGESILASVNALVEAVHDSHDPGDLLVLAISSFVVAAGLWWVYFFGEHHRRLDGVRSGIVYGYGHYFVFGAAGALSAGVEVVIDHRGGDGELSSTATAAVITLPVTVFLVAVWCLVLRHELSAARGAVVLVLSVATSAGALTPRPVLACAVLLAVTVAVLERARATS